MKRATGFSGRAGFTLVELVIASVILAVLLTGVGYFFTNMIKQSDVLDDRTRGMEICRQGLEEMQTVDADTLTIGRTAWVEVQPGFDRAFVISEYDPLLPNARQVRCVVMWSGAAGPDSVSFSTIF
jgi:prepilin-type N-terminal cleavage/methylation domain-containing protein